MGLDPVVALEIGTSHVRALVGEMREDGHIMITGVGVCPSRGVRKGEIIDFENALACVRTALHEAEDQGQVTIGEIHLVVSGGYIQAVLNRGSVPVSGPGGEITEDDIEHALETGRAISLPMEREILHTITQQFYIDDREGVVNPEGMIGSKLAVSTLILHGVRNRIRNTVKVVKSAQTEVQDVAFGGLCAGLAVLTPEQKENGAVVIDLGGGTTDYVVYANKCIALAGSISVGGDHVTNDLALGLGVPLANAERIKIEQGNAMVEEGADEQFVVLQPSGGFAGRSIRLSAIQMIMHVRLQETLDLIRSELYERQLNNLIGSGAILTGGGAYTKGICELVSDIYEMPAQIGKPRNISGLAVATEGPEFAAPVGMVRYGFMTGRREFSSGKLTSFIKNMFRR